MAKYTVRVVGTSPVWADIEVEADSITEAREKAQDTEPRFTAAWQLSEGNGVNDWEFDMVIGADGNQLNEEDEEEG